jgi:hypothetical protein
MLRRLTTIASFATLLLAPHFTGAQQVTTPPDTIRFPTGPTAEAARVGVAQAKTRDKTPLVFYGALAGAAVSVAIFHVDPDTGGYHDGWTTATDFPDKAVHALAAWALTSVGVDLGVRPRYSATAVCAAGTAFEFAQGYVSIYDIVADCTGAIGAAAWQGWRARKRARATRTR